LTEALTGAAPRNHEGLGTSFYLTRYVKLTTTNQALFHALTLFEKQPVTSAPEEVPLSDMPVKRLSIVGGVRTLLFALYALRCLSLTTEVLAVSGSADLGKNRSPAAVPTTGEAK
jgi:hypothetical protein